jgi:hypothetical protein
MRANEPRWMNFPHKEGKALGIEGEIASIGLRMDIEAYR